MRSRVPSFSSIVRALVVASTFVGAIAQASTSASYLCETTDRRSKLFIDFTIDFNGGGQSLEQLSSRDMSEESLSGVTIFVPSVMHVESLQAEKYGYVLIHGQTSKSDSLLHMSLTMARVDGPETPWPLMHGWVQIRSPRGYQARRVSCFMSASHPN
jgi:hypothetical protein